MDQSEINQLVYDYGYAVMRRERLAHFDGSGFDGWNRECLRLWQEMKKQGCYSEPEGYKLFPQYEPYYYAGLGGEKYPQESEAKDGA